MVPLHECMNQLSPPSYYELISCPHQATKLVPAHQLSSPSYYQLISCPPSSYYYQLISCPHQATTSSSVVPTKLLRAHQLSPPSYYELISCPHQAVGAAESRPSTQKRTMKTLLKKEQVRLASYHMLMCLNKF